MTKEELKEKLKVHKENKARLNIKLKELKSLQIEIKNLDKYETNIITTYGTNQDIYSKNQISDKVSKKIEENETKRSKLMKKIDNLEKEVKELIDKVDFIEDRLQALKYKEREIFEAYYIDGRTADNISRILYYEMYQRNCTPRYIQKIIEQTTNKMLKI